MRRRRWRASSTLRFTNAADQLASIGAGVSIACPRRQLSPSSRVENCATDNRITPSCMLGQQNAPFSSRFANRHVPVLPRRSASPDPLAWRRRRRRRPRTDQPSCPRAPTRRALRRLYGSPPAWSLPEPGQFLLARSRRPLQRRDDCRHRPDVRATPDPDETAADLDLTMPNICCRTAPPLASRSSITAGMKIAPLMRSGSALAAPACAR